MSIVFGNNFNSHILGFSSSNANCNTNPNNFNPNIETFDNNRRNKRYADQPHLRSLTWAEWEAAKTQRTNDAIRWTYNANVRPAPTHSRKRYSRKPNPGYLQHRETPKESRKTYYSSQRFYAKSPSRVGRSVDYMPKLKRPHPHVPLYYSPRHGQILHTTRITRITRAILPKIVHTRVDPPAGMIISHWPFKPLDSKRTTKRSYYKPGQHLRFRKRPAKKNVRNIAETKQVCVKKFFLINSFFQNHWYARYKNTHPAYQRNNVG